MNKKNTYIFLVIVLLATVLRFVGLSNNPPALNWDEVSHGYNAYSILKTGKDEWGKAFPILNFRAYGDYPLPLNLYLTIPFIYTLGLNEFSIRIPHAILGVITVIAIYYLVLGLTKKKNTALLASFLAAIGPWYLFTSRFVVQSNLSVFSLIAAVAFFVNREKKRYFIIISILFLWLTLFSYHTTRIFSPLLLVFVLFLYRKDIVDFFKKGKLINIHWVSIILVCLFFGFSIFILSRPETRVRSSEVFLIDSGMVGNIIEARNSSALPLPVTRLLHNRPVYFTKEFLKNYFQYLSPKYLFIEGGTQYQFSVPNHGLLYLINLPLFYLGLIYLVKRVLKGKKNYKLLLFWLILSPIPASMTKESYAVIRSTTMLPLPEIVSSLGLLFVFDWFKKKKINKSVLLFFSGIYLVITSMLLISYLTKYFNKYRIKYSWAWQYGYKQAVQYTKEHYDDYDKIIVTKKYGEPHEFFLFFWPWDPQKYRDDPNLIRFEQSNWFWVDRFDKFYFVNDWQINQEGTNNYEFILESGSAVNCQRTTVNCLLITSPDNYPKGWSKLETINFLDGKPVFEIYENLGGVIIYE